MPLWNTNISSMSRKYYICNMFFLFVIHATKSWYQTGEKKKKKFLATTTCREQIHHEANKIFIQSENYEHQNTKHHSNIFLHIENLTTMIQVHWSTADLCPYNLKNTALTISKYGYCFFSSAFLGCKRKVTMTDWEMNLTL